MTKVVNKDKAVGAVANQITHVVLQYFAFQFTYVKKNNDYLKTVDGWLDFSIAITTEDGAVKQSLWFKDGKVDFDQEAFRETAEYIKDNVSDKTKLQDALLVLNKINGSMDLVLLIKKRLKSYDKK